MSEIFKPSPQDTLPDSQESTPSPEVTTELDTKLVNNLANEAYQIVAEKHGYDPNAVYHLRSCEQVTPVLLQKLQANGLACQAVIYTGWDITSHEFLLVDNRYVVDATWQQFLDQPNPSLPQVLICTTDKLGATLTELNIPLNNHHIWLSRITK